MEGDQDSGNDSDQFWERQKALPDDWARGEDGAEDDNEAEETDDAEGMVEADEGGPEARG